MIKVVADNESLSPNILYKYRDWGNNLHKRILTEGELYLAPPDSFEDEYDCNPIIQPLDGNELRDFFRRYSNSKNPSFSKIQHQQFVDECMRYSPMANPVLYQEKLREIREDFSSRYGVLSMTEDPDNIRMWNKYAANGTGICIGFDGKILSQHVGGGGPVIYDNRIPSYKFGTLSQDSEIELTILHKSEDWAFEKEYRLTRMQDHVYSNAERIIRIPSAIKVIVLGSNMPVDWKQEIYEIVNRSYPDAKLTEL